MVLLSFDPPARVRRTRDGAAPKPQTTIAADGDDEYDDDYDTELAAVQPAPRNPLAACLLWPCAVATRAPILCCLVTGPACPCFWLGGKSMER